MITKLGLYGGPAKPQVFVAKPPSSGGEEHPAQNLTMIRCGFPGQRYGGFIAKAGPGDLEPSTAYEREILTVQLGGGIGRSINMKKAIDSLRTELESFIFFMGGR